MRPGDLQPSSFAAYPEASRALAVQHLALLQAMPLSLLPSYLTQIQQYPTLFPIEQLRLARQLQALAAAPSLMQRFAAIQLPPAIDTQDWLHHPEQYVAMFSGALWQSGQIDAYHRAAEALFAALPRVERHGGVAPLLIAVIGQGSKPGHYPLFTRLRSQGLYARKVDQSRMAEVLGATLSRRAAADLAGNEHGNASNDAHWYIDGGLPWALPATASAVQRFTFPSLAAVTDAVLREMDKAVREGTGPEILADRLRAMRPEALGLETVTSDPRLQRFFISLLTEGSGTQLYSTSFVQAAAVELIRRAQPQTLLLRFAPRRKPASMNDMLEQRAQGVELDPDGALVDADMAVHYAWLALNRQPGGDKAQLLVLVEGQGEAFMAGGAVTRGVETQTPLSVAQALELLA